MSEKHVYFYRVNRALLQVEYKHKLWHGDRFRQRPAVTRRLARLELYAARAITGQRRWAVPPQRDAA